MHERIDGCEMCSEREGEEDTSRVMTRNSLSVEADIPIGAAGAVEHTHRVGVGVHVLDCAWERLGLTNDRFTRQQGR